MPAHGEDCANHHSGENLMNNPEHRWCEACEKWVNNADFSETHFDKSCKS